MEVLEDLETQSSPESARPDEKRANSFGRAVLRRLASTVVTLFGATVVVFLLVQLVPGDPVRVIAGEDASTERVEELREELGYNDPLPIQYGRWVGDLVRGDLGESALTGEPVADMLQRTFPRSLHVIVSGLAVAVLLGIPLGIWAALRANGPIDASIRLVATAGLAVPNFWLGLIFVTAFALSVSWLPATGFVPVTDGVVESIRHLILPALTIGLSAMAAITRQTRSAMMEVLDADFVRTLRAMGLKRRLIVWQHALRNASIPVVTIIGIDISRLIGGTVVIESVFGINGVGSLVVGATQGRDFPVVQGVMLLVVFFVVITNLIVDLTYTWLDPRITMS